MLNLVVCVGSNNQAWKRSNALLKEDMHNLLSSSAIRSTHCEQQINCNESINKYQHNCHLSSRPLYFYSRFLLAFPFCSCNICHQNSSEASPRLLWFSYTLRWQFVLHAISVIAADCTFVVVAVQVLVHFLEIRSAALSFCSAVTTQKW